MKKFLLALAFLSATGAFAACEQMFPYGKPVVRGNFIELCRKGYAVIYNNEKKIPFVTYEKLTPDTIGRGQSERTSFKVDLDINVKYRSTPKNYERTGQIYDRGHLANAQNAGDDAAMADTMLMSNIVPQVNSFNRGSWKTLETRLAKDVRRGATYYVITGAIPSDQYIDNKISIPKYLFKVVVDGKKVTSYLMPNEVNNRSYKDFQISYNELSGIIGVDLLPARKAN